MTNVQLLHAIGQIDEQLIHEADRTVKRSHWTRVLATAACFCVVCIAIASIANSRNLGAKMDVANDYSCESVTTTESGTNDTAMAPEQVSTLEDAEAITGYETVLPQEVEIDGTILVFGDGSIQIPMNNGMTLVKEIVTDATVMEPPVIYDEKETTTYGSIETNGFNIVGAEDSENHVIIWRRGEFQYSLYYGEATQSELATLVEGIE